MKWRKLMFVLPNLFTASSIFCGFYAITLCAGDPSPRKLYQAALAVFFAVFFDGFDGRVARLTKTQSEFGTELDSLADVISFGAAPGILVYKWALAPLGLAGLFLSFAFVTCGALRLARFNVLARRPTHHGGGSKFFVGLPIPLAGGTIASLVIAHYSLGAESVQAHVSVAVVTAILSFLMVSNVRYRTFKDVHLSKKSATVFAVLCLAGVVVATQVRPSFVLVVSLATYVFLGLAEEVVFFRRRRAESRAASIATAGPAPMPPVSADVDEDDEEEEDDVDEEDYM
jgi:CDP-diacylglycerol---serine O-phosphatidyltransferase